MKAIGNNFLPDRFVPYIQMYELEALLFAEPDEMAAVFEYPDLSVKFSQIVMECGGCERIDDDPHTAPAKRIEALFPNYKKGAGIRAHAPVILERIGIPRIRAACPHFNGWLTKLESFAGS